MGCPEKWFPLTVNHAPKPCKIFYTCIFPTIDFHPKKIEERQKQQNRRELRSHIQATARASIAHPSTSKSFDRTSKHRRVAPLHRWDRRTPTPPRSSPPKTDLVLDPKIIYTAILAIVLDHHHSRPLDLMIFFFLLGFVSFVFIYWEMILYICLKAEKMWVISKKCVFYSIFKNTTKHQKIFFKAFFEMQQNTWKYFHFPKIFLPKNILHLENILYWNKCSLNVHNFQRIDTIVYFQGMYTILFNEHNF